MELKNDNPTITPRVFYVETTLKQRGIHVLCLRRNSISQHISLQSKKIANFYFYEEI